MDGLSKVIFAHVFAFARSSRSVEEIELRVEDFFTLASRCFSAIR